MDLNKLSSELIGTAIEVHKVLGPGLLESAYEECFCFELGLRGLPFDRQLSLPIVYKEFNLDCGYRIDVLVDKKIIVELKSCATLEPIHKAQILTYMKLMDIKLGLLLNFNVELMKDGIVRVINGQINR